MFETTNILHRQTKICGYYEIMLKQMIKQGGLLPFSPLFAEPMPLPTQI